MMNSHVPLSMATVLALAATVFAGEDVYVRPDYPPLAHSVTPELIDKVIDDAPPCALITLPASYAKQLPERRRVATNALARAAIEYLKPVIDDSRVNIPELNGLSDEQVALLYLLQMKKSADELMSIAPTNTMEYLIGAGMRLDILSQHD